MSHSQQCLGVLLALHLEIIPDSFHEIYMECRGSNHSHRHATCKTSTLPVNYFSVPIN